jgi:mannose-6-phosphate isomerase-like protein (cupin superfamily)
MDYFNQDIVEVAKANTLFRKELVTGPHSQIVIMSLKPGEDIGEEVHQVDQTLAFVLGEGKAVLNDKESHIASGHLVFVPAGTKHNFINTGMVDMKLYTVYAPAEHKPGTVHATKKDAEGEEHMQH